MSNLADRIADARPHVTPRWSPAREREAQIRLEAKLVRQRRRRVVLLASLAFVSFALAAFVLLRPLSGAPRPGTASVVREAAPLALLQLEDGSTVTPASPDARVEPLEIEPGEVAVKLAEGSARFSVTPNPERKFRVVARDVTVTVLGTIFTVGLEPNGVRVGVERGRVRVEWPAGERVLAVGEQFLVEPAPDAALESAGAATSTIPEGPAAAPAPSDRAARIAARSAPETSWRTLAQDGDYARAFTRMAAEGPGAIRDEPGDLLLAADVARLGGHAEKAVSRLERVVTAHASDSRAPLAAFTLGRTLLDQLGRPREAAQAFSTARKLDPSGALAQDALAREVESWSRAGEASLAHERATAYVEAYPKGRRLAAVKRLGGIE